MNYISFIDLVGTKNNSRYNVDAYRESIVNFQAALVRGASKFKEQDGRIHFFSDCAFIESQNLIKLIMYLRDIRDELMASDIFIKGAIINGFLAAINGSEEEKFIETAYGKDKHVKEIRKSYERLKKNSSVINGTLFFSPDVGSVFKYQDELKGCSIYIDETLIADIEEYSVLSGYISDISKNSFISFWDIKYDEYSISSLFLDNVIRHYTMSNTYNIKFGRYYMSILISCINSVNFNPVLYENVSGKFEHAPEIFDKIISLQKTNPKLYQKAFGLEYIYFSLLNKIYSDKGRNDSTTKEILKRILTNKKYIDKYLNNFASISDVLIFRNNKKLLLNDYYDLIRENALL